MEIECKWCGAVNRVECEDMPDHASDSVAIECCECGHEFRVGWCGYVELR